MAFELKVLTLIGSGLLGALIGFVSKAHLSRLDFKQKTIESVVNRYLNARDEICDILSKCAIKSTPIEPNWTEEIRDSISLAYYKYYDYIPKIVIQELICFQACLVDSKHRLFKIKDNNLVLLNNEETINLCEEISVIDNISHSLYYNLCNLPDKERIATRIQFQSRHTLSMINKGFTEENLTTLRIFGPKNTV